MRKLLFASALALLCLLPLQSEAGIGWVQASGDFKNFGFCMEDVGKEHYSIFYFGPYYMTTQHVPQELFDRTSEAIIHASHNQTRIILQWVREEGNTNQKICGMGDPHPAPTYNEVTGAEFTGA